MAKKATGSKKRKSKKGQDVAKTAYKIQGVRVPDWPEIKSYFRTIDQQHMLADSGGALDLFDCQSVLNQAEAIFQQVASGRMPLGGPQWTPEMINGFFAWWQSDPTCPAPATGARTSAGAVSTKKHEMEGIHVPDWEEIKSYFTDVDQQHMLAQSGGTLDLHDCQSVLDNAEAIFQIVAQGRMPPGAPWNSEKVNNFFTWWKSNPECS